MKVQFGGRTYFIRFTHNRKKGQGPSKQYPERKRINGKSATRTTCHLEIYKENSDNTPVDHATVRLHSEDVPCYEKARKFALKKLLEKTVPGPGNKDFRSAIWNAYLQRPRPTKRLKINFRHPMNRSRENAEESIHERQQY